MRFVKPLDKKQLHKIFQKYQNILTIEDGCKAGGFGSAVLEFANEIGYAHKLVILGIDDVFLDHGTVKELQALANIDASAIKNQLKIFLNV